ncbi:MULTISPECIES: SDR family oxidoreductase [unclassified Sphingobium]|uniref:SDR family oxidoreductase n=1 Tax=unclassified Sphingobium TaxID=2611147 RepID=UPI00119B2AE7|nr:MULTISPECIES: SDR family oxidoreductase [unclassified Sphingobium]MBG6119946.1 NAD(P)-dependent dehydrogenase (short-subunit alcohol dehydrogenase family) [Sphingobium sp. JAI105]TWC99615.1 NAD(P)-dependent dehydrogenase (short-subunit alcohol dehydrogenase family) [Sphingobium sp. AEW010]TWD18948.1 NAD(P)-dependent dehydrogenase (short-subunit alcohol dehydrogenase family) [Sphingobium sp. AEW013]TWD21819.1 NAD(P)-dependent dehydrogenase (short-subunit alcohol dehydrogenase family) [Sphingo
MRTTIITGAGAGIGRALADLLRSRGEQVVGIDLKDADCTADLSKEEERSRVVAHILATQARIDAVVTCAGISPPATGDQIISVNYFGSVRLLEGLLPRLQEADAPRAVVISSVASLYTPGDELVNACLADDEAGGRAIAANDASLAYRSSKRAMTQWVRRTAATPQWGGRGVLLNGISPGMVLSRMGQAALATPEGRENIARNVPTAVRDYADPADIAPTLAFLASADNRFMVGQVPFVDGGADVLLRGDQPL